MSLKPSEAEHILATRLGEPVKAPTKYVVGFRTRHGRVLALHRTVAETGIMKSAIFKWFAGSSIFGKAMPTTASSCVCWISSAMGIKRSSPRRVYPAVSVWLGRTAERAGSMKQCPILAPATKIARASKRLCADLRGGVCVAGEAMWRHS